LKSVAFPVPEIIGGTPKIWAVPGYAHTSFSPKKFSWPFIRMDPLSVLAKFETKIVKIGQPWRPVGEVKKQNKEN